MKMGLPTVGMLSILALTACSHSPAPPPNFKTCAAAAAYYKGLVGGPLEHTVGFIPNRVVLPNSAVTMDFNPLRLNVYIDNADRIKDARCG